MPLGSIGINEKAQLKGMVKSNSLTSVKPIPAFYLGKQGYFWSAMATGWSWRLSCERFANTGFHGFLDTIFVFQNLASTVFRVNDLRCRKNAANGFRVGSERSIAAFKFLKIEKSVQKSVDSCVGVCSVLALVGFRGGGRCMQLAWLACKGICGALVLGKLRNSV